MGNTHSDNLIKRRKSGLLSKSNRKEGERCPSFLRSILSRIAARRRPKTTEKEDTVINDLASILREPDFLSSQDNKRLVSELLNMMSFASSWVEGETDMERSCVDIEASGATQEIGMRGAKSCTTLFRNNESGNEASYIPSCSMPKHAIYYAFTIPLDDHGCEFGSRDGDMQDIRQNTKSFKRWHAIPNHKMKNIAVRVELCVDPAIYNEPVPTKYNEKIIMYVKAMRVLLVKLSSIKSSSIHNIEIKEREKYLTVFLKPQHASGDKGGITFCDKLAEQALIDAQQEYAQINDDKDILPKCIQILLYGYIGAIMQHGNPSEDELFYSDEDDALISTSSANDVKQSAQDIYQKIQKYCANRFQQYTQDREALQEILQEKYPYNYLAAPQEGQWTQFLSMRSAAVDVSMSR